MSEPISVRPTAAGSRPLVVSRARLLVEVCHDRGLRFLSVRSKVADQSFLLPLGHRPALAGLSMVSRLGRLSGLCWALAYGVGELPACARVRFATDTLRYRRCCEVPALRLDDQVWVSDAEGLFSNATLLAGGDTPTRVVALAGRW